MTTPTCQHSSSGMGATCFTVVTSFYRQCGVSGGTCKKVIAYCEAHGGEKRATEEMVEHHAAAHPVDNAWTMDVVVVGDKNTQEKP